PEVTTSSRTVGDARGRSYKAEYYVVLQPFGKRTETTTQVKAEVRELLKPYAEYAPKVKDVDFVGGVQRPFTINIRGQQLSELRQVASELYEKVKKHPGLLDPEISDKPGLPEFQIDIDRTKALEYGVTPA